MINNTEARDPTRVGLLLSLFSDRTREGIMAALATNPTSVRDSIARAGSGSKTIPPIMAVMDRATADLLPDMMRGIASVIAADMSMTAFDKRRAAQVVKFLGLPESSLHGLASSQNELDMLIKSEKLRNLRALNTAASGQAYKPAIIYAWYLLIGKAIGEAMQLQSLMDEPALSVTRIAEAGDVESTARELGDALLADAAREQGEAMGFALPEAGDPEQGFVPAAYAAMTAGAPVARSITGSFMSAKRRRRRRRARRAAQQPAVSAEIMRGLESPEPSEQAAAKQAAQSLEQPQQTQQSLQSQSEPDFRTEVSTSVQSGGDEGFGDWRQSSDDVPDNY